MKEGNLKKSANVVNLTSKDLTNKHSRIFSSFKQKKNESSEEARKIIYNFFKRTPFFADLINKYGKDYSDFRVIFPKGIREKIKNGEYFITKKNGTDEFLAIVKNSKTNKIVKHLRLEDIGEKEKLKELLPSLQNMSIMESLADLSKKLETIEEKLIDMHKEFNNNRIGKIQAGYSLYLDALVMNSIENKNSTLRSARNLAIEGRSQLIESIQQRVSNLKTAYWEIFFKELGFKKINGFEKGQIINIEEIINEYFYIQRSSQIIVLISKEMNEDDAMVQSLADLNDITKFLNSAEVLEKINKWDKSGIEWKKNTKSSLKSINEVFDSKNNNNKEIEIDFKKLNDE